MNLLKLILIINFACVGFYGAAWGEQAQQSSTEEADAALKIKDYVSPDSQAVTSGIDDTEWLFGEVISIDALLKKFVVRYLDYETNTEKEMTVYSGENTILDGVASVEEIKEKDSVSLNYKIDPQENRCVASTISVVRDPGNETIPLADILSIDNSMPAEKDLTDVKNPPAAEQPRQ